MATDKDRGFSLTEMLVVLAIIAILMSVAVPTLLGPKERAQDAAAQARLVAGLKTEEVFAAGGNGYSGNQTVLEALEPSLDWSSKEPGVLHVVVASVEGTNDAVLLYTRSNSGTWFGLRQDRAGAGRHTCSGVAVGDVDDMNACTGLDW